MEGKNKYNYFFYEKIEYTNKDYRELVRKNKIKGSMSRKWNCYDNATAESFHATTKKELMY